MRSRGRSDIGTSAHEDRRFGRAGKRHQSQCAGRKASAGAVAVSGVQCHGDSRGRDRGGTDAEVGRRHDRRVGKGMHPR